MSSIDQYTFIDVPGTRKIRIPIVKRTSEQEEDSTGVRLPDWIVSITGESVITASNFPDFDEYIELFGFYYELSRYVTGDSSNNLYTSGTLWHSDVFLVTQNGLHNVSINKAIADGTIFPEVDILRISKINGETKVIQQLTFETCHWCSSQSYLDWTIVAFTACTRTNKIQGFSQEGGLSKGFAAYTTSYTQNTTTGEE